MVQPLTRRSPRRFVVKKGLDLPLGGAPCQRIEQGPTVGSVALVADDYVGLRASLLVREGEQVALGQPLFEDRNNPGVLFTSPGAGTVARIHRGERRALEVTLRYRSTNQSGLHAVL